MKHRFPILLAMAAFAWSAPFSLPAAEVSLEQAETAVANWIRLGRDPAGRREAVVETSRTVVDEETGAAVHVVRLAGGGLLVRLAALFRGGLLFFWQGGRRPRRSLQLELAASA